MSETAAFPAFPAFPLPFTSRYRLPVAEIRTLRELAMMQMSALIRAKPEWHVKMNDADIVARWTREAADQAQGAYLLRRDLLQGAVVVVRLRRRAGGSRAPAAREPARGRQPGGQRGQDGAQTERATAAAQQQP